MEGSRPPMPQLIRMPLLLAALLVFAQTGVDTATQLARHRNLGKAFFENPTTHELSAAEFGKAVALPGATTADRVNFGIALLAAGKTNEGIAELERAQRQDAAIPHTWFNLGIQYKKAGDYEKARRQLEQMARLVKDEPITHYNLCTLYKLEDRLADARREFELASQLAPHLAAPHFQLFNLLRQSGDAEGARRRLALFQQAKKDAENSPVPEDMEWSFYSEVIDERPAPPPPAFPAPLSEARGDFNNDGLQDKLVFRNGAPVLLRATASGFVEHPLPAPKGSYRAAVWLDYDHDYDLDLFLLGDRSALLRNKMDAGFDDATAQFPFVDGLAESGVAFRFVPDTRGMDLLVHYKDRPSILYRDRLSGKFEATPAPNFPTAPPAPKPAGNTWVSIRLTGVKNLKLAEGSEVEVKAGAFYARQIYHGTPLRFALPAVKELDAVRITWPNGLIQSEARQPVNRALAFREAQRLSGSCPTIWTWDGHRFRYITDVLGVAPLGAAAGNGHYFPTDHEESIVLPEGALQARDGRYEIRITEELAEVTYLDQVRLLSVDHPDGATLVTNEKFQSAPFPAMRLDLAFRPAPLHLEGTELKLPSTLPPSPVLLLTGWVDWADGSTFLGLAQAGKPIRLPKLEAQTADGRWHTVYEEMGMPAGKPKTIAVPLNRRLPLGARRLRISSNIAVHWTSAALAGLSGAPVPHELSLVSTDLRFRGFSRALIDPARRRPEEFFYADPSPESMWNPTQGTYSHYGVVTPLLSTVDDRMVIMGSGDELALRFDARALPPPAAGYRRSFVLVVDGWAKDQDPNTAFSQTVEPLPFHGMSGYPYGPNERFPDTPAHRDWRNQYQTRPALRPLRALTRPRGASE
jgi:tetratricopeptide (TPR) repeat protein